MKRGFTLIELLMVIAIIAIVSTLAVNKIGNLRRTSSEKVSLANQVAIERAFEAYLTVHNGRVNRLDALMYMNTGLGGERGFETAHTNYSRLSGQFVYCGPRTPTALTENQIDLNAGLTPNLRSLLVPYSISRAEATAFNDMLGLRYVMCHTDDATVSPRAKYGDRATYGDGSYLSDDATIGWDPARSACIAQALTNGFYLAAIPPFTAAGRAVYRDCGQELFATESTDAQYVENDCIAEAKATGGILFAFGLGENCSAIGKGHAGLEAAPYAEYPLKRFYRHYILLFRLNPDKKTAASTPEFAGVLDPCGKTLRTARESVDQL